MRLVKYRGKWAIYTRDERGRPRRRSLETEDRAEAERRLLDLQQDTRRQRSATTVSEIVGAYLKDRKDRIAHPEAMEVAWRTATPFFGHLRPDQVTADLCRQFTRQRVAAGYSRGTVRKQLSIIAAALRWQDRNTPARVELPPPPPPRLRRISRAEAERLIAAAGSPHVRLFIILAIATAARMGAILDLTWDRVDLDKGRIDLGEGPTKTKGRAVVPINDMARAALEEAREAAETDWVVEYAGRKVGAIKKAFQRAVERAGLDGVTPHVLRHSAAVWMAEAGVPMSEISQYMGHSSTKVTERVYARFSPGHLRKAADALVVQVNKEPLRKKPLKP